LEIKVVEELEEVDLKKMLMVNMIVVEAVEPVSPEQVQHA